MSNTQVAYLENCITVSEELIQLKRTLMEAWYRYHSFRDMNVPSEPIENRIVHDILVEKAFMDMRAAQAHYQQAVNAAAREL